MTTLTLTPDLTFARVRVVYTDAAGATLYRDGAPVRGGEDLDNSGVVDDYEAPFGRPVTYTLGAASGTVTLEVDRPWLTHPLDASLSRPLAAVESDDDWTWTAPGAPFYVIGAVRPTVVHGPRNDRAGRLRVHVDPADDDAFRALLADGSVLLLRTPDGCPVVDLALWPRAATRSRVGPVDAPRRIAWDLDYLEATLPAGPVPGDPANPWSAVPIEHATWDDVVASHADWSDVLATPHPHPVTP